jgi:hypothetical protein
MAALALAPPQVALLPLIFGHDLISVENRRVRVPAWPSLLAPLRGARGVQLTIAVPLLLPPLGAERLFLRSSRTVVRRRASPVPGRTTLAVGRGRATTARWWGRWLRSIWPRRCTRRGRRVDKGQGALREPWLD